MKRLSVVMKMPLAHWPENRRKLCIATRQLKNSFSTLAATAASQARTLCCIPKNRLCNLTAKAAIPPNKHVLLSEKRNLWAQYCLLKQDFHVCAYKTFVYGNQRHYVHALR